MNRLNITLLIAELLCLTLIVIGTRLIFWEYQTLFGGLIIGIAACMSVLIVLVLVFHETEEPVLTPAPATHTHDCPADLTVFHGIVERAWQHRWTLDNYDKVHITLKREVASGKAEVMNVYWNTKDEAYTVQTTINHPKTGRKQLNRRGLSQEDVFRLLEHPRAHTDKGYYKK